MWRAVPSAPRCKMCHSPFGMPGGPVLRLVGKGRWPGNPKYCAGCFKDLYRNRHGAEIDCSLLFADVRGSTTLAEGMAASEFRALLDRFYATATRILVDHEAIVDKFAGDEVIGIFIPALAGDDHASRAVEAGLELLQGMRDGPESAATPIGVGVNSGVAFVGVVGTADHVEFTALGDAVNIAARLSSLAGAGELLVTASTAEAAGLQREQLKPRRLALKGRSEATDAYVLHAAQG
jgi:adenylate cyclase